MSESHEWDSVINGKNYTFLYLPANATLLINGVEHTIPSRFSHILSIDEALRFDGLDARFIIEKKVPDVVINGVCLRSGKAYTGKPMWAIVLAVICAAFPFIVWGTLIPTALGIISALLCMRIAKSALPMAAKIFLCILLASAIFSFTIWLYPLFY